MRTILTLTATGAIVAAMPAFAQFGVDVGAQAGARVGVDPAGTVGGVTGRLGTTVDRLDGAADRAIDATDLSPATRDHVRTGAELRDSSGHSVGTVQSLDGDIAIVVRGGKLYNVPLSAIYHDASGRVKGLVTKLPRADFKARAAGGVAID
ncbi:hypothetical protein EAO27_13960 [Sphingopyxis sp. YF1]|jgi:hypothetical protein|uniref:hypothetical protein n=1 Tax=Sphingopyxis sp. YF1 TaxID=2482763 RepID=UPI001F610986|nr:hypothetical protein [Sphingopyxis sp. YF1]UNU43705.1 hypothetical protein EAO27_13960 [Sphingopyxis sp. YF1]